MKTERRHELQTNVLADWLGKKVGGIRPYVKSIAAVALLLLAAFFAYMVISGSQASRSGNSWAAYLAAFNQRDADLLERVAAANQGTVAALWAKQSMADLELADGTAQLYLNRDAAAEALENAAEAYASVAQDAGKHPMLRRRAEFGLAQANECLSVLTKNDNKIQEYLDKARDNYELVAKEAAGTALGEMAAERLKMVQDLQGQADDGEAAGGKSNWYAWLANQEIPPPNAGGQGMPGDFGLGGGTPRVGTNTMPSGPPREPLPDAPSLDLPFPLDDAPPSSEPPSSEPASSEPAATPDAPQPDKPEAPEKPEASPPTEEPDSPDTPDASETPEKPAAPGAEPADAADAASENAKESEESDKSAPEDAPESPDSGAEDAGEGDASSGESPAS